MDGLLHKTPSAAASSVAPVEQCHSFETGCFRLHRAVFEPVLYASSTVVNGCQRITHALARIRVASWGMATRCAPHTIGCTCAHSYIIATKPYTVLHTKIRQYMYSQSCGDQQCAVCFMVYVTNTYVQISYSQEHFVHAPLDTAVSGAYVWLIAGVAHHSKRHSVTHPSTPSTFKAQCRGVYNASSARVALWQQLMPCMGV